jgi:hypothetical protein
MKRIDYKTIEIKYYGQTKILKRQASSMGLKSWYDIKGEIYA